MTDPAPLARVASALVDVLVTENSGEARGADAFVALRHWQTRCGVFAGARGAKVGHLAELAAVLRLAGALKLVQAPKQLAFSMLSARARGTRAVRIDCFAHRTDVTHFTGTFRVYRSRDYLASAVIVAPVSADSARIVKLTVVADKIVRTSAITITGRGSNT